MYKVFYAGSFERDIKKFLKKGGDKNRLKEAIKGLKLNKPMDRKWRDHQLKGRLRHYRELHIAHDWLLVYEKDGKQLRIVCLWLVTHKQLEERGRAI